MKKSDKLYIAGHRGMEGSAIKRHLTKLNNMGRKVEMLLIEELDKYIKHNDWKS